MKKIFSLALLFFLIINTNNTCVYARTGFEKTPFRGVMIAEAGGSYEETKGVNSKQSVDKSISDGYKVIEVDISITKDNEAVCINRWTKKTFDKLKINSKNGLSLSYKEFMNMKICEKYDPLDAGMIYQYVYDTSHDGLISKTPDVQFIVDFGSIEEKWTAFDCMRSFCTKFENCLNIVTYKIYNETMYEGMTLLCELSNYMYVVDSKSDIENIDNILEFCSDKNFMSIQIKNDIITKEIVDKCHEYGLQVVSTTTNSENKAKKLIELGVDCIATNTISPDFGENK